ncbi:interferon-induced very large GTPase 1-like isoform X3 [Xenopus tropicalis]|uniref:Interferon-induced very large GTPase 1-like isoform X3 n=1 Tax=Xenopus tropicalis TaxID=8364 RepID=A0A8J1IV60_XENTR|nr:interferon-induced very large GTPase 1-like isoform X3 [Xenopus tropicalis]
MSYPLRPQNSRQRGSTGNPANRNSFPEEIQHDPIRPENPDEEEKPEVNYVRGMIRRINSMSIKPDTNGRNIQKPKDIKYQETKSPSYSKSPENINWKTGNGTHHLNQSHLEDRSQQPEDIPRHKEEKPEVNYTRGMIRRKNSMSIKPDTNERNIQKPKDRTYQEKKSPSRSKSPEIMKRKTGNGTHHLNQSHSEDRSQQPEDIPRYPQSDLKGRRLSQRSSLPRPSIPEKPTNIKSETCPPKSPQLKTVAVNDLRKNSVRESSQNFPCDKKVRAMKERNLPPRPALPSRVSEVKRETCPPEPSQPLNTVNAKQQEEKYGPDHCHKPQEHHQEQGATSHLHMADIKFMASDCKRHCPGAAGSQLRNPKRRPLPIFSQHQPYKHSDEPDLDLYTDPSCDQEPISQEEASSSTTPSGRREAFADILSQLKMQKSKLSPKDVLSIGKESVMNVELKTVEDIPQYFLQKVMALDVGARNTTLNQPSPGRGDQWDLTFNEYESMDLQNSIHPLDVLCAVFHCSDNVLQQELISKMSLCQFAVPLILPTGDGTECTFLLWAMRGIVKRWRPHSLAETRGFIEDNLVNVCMPTFSFVRLGECNLSKSKILNQLLCQPQTYYDIFVNHDMDCGNQEKRIADGLVEISWFFPGNLNKSEMFEEPVAVTNLRGDLKSNWRQFAFLANVSLAVFILTKYLSEKDYELVLSCKDAKTHYYFIIDISAGKQPDKETIEIVKKMSKEPNVHFLKASIRNVTELVKQIRQVVVKCLGSPVSIQDLADTAPKHGIQVDENSLECQKAKTQAISITSEIKNVAEFKGKAMPLQGNLWKELAKIEKEQCRMKYQGSTNINTYKRELSRKCFELHRTQYQCEVPRSIKNYMNSLMTLSPVEREYFIRWMKFYLEVITRKSLSGLQAEYKEKYNELSKNPNKLNELYHKMSDSSLGVDHFLRELGQFYEAECCMVDGNQIQSNERQFSKLPGVAADLLLDGFPLELIDGDASNIPLKWITAVLKELNKKTEGRCRMRVITVLGVQSTGKSTLLNTMFGLQFPVASGRCTRGAFMTLIKVKENFQKELGCDFILVIDTEGLKAPEMASLEDSYEHDNELATLVIGLSDITIVNMAMENITEMKDILQIVVHAFLRMKEVGRKRNCFLVHQNVNDVSAYLNNRINRNKLLNELNEMTCIAAKMEKINLSLDFTDIITYNPDKHSWYIPGLWHGVPPMAPINSGYSENIFKLKKSLVELMKASECPAPQNIDSFIEWIQSLWKAVKFETFIFNFRNILVAEAYEQLSTKYSELEWNFRKRVYSWVTEQENVIKNQPQSKLESIMTEILNNETSKLLDRQEAHMTEQLKYFFDTGSNRMYLAERYRADFLSYVKCLRKNLEVIISNKCWEAVRIHSGKQEVQKLQECCQKFLEDKVDIHMRNQNLKLRHMSDSELKEEFESMWEQILSELQVGRLRKHRIDVEILEQLTKEMRNKDGAVQEKLQSIKSLKDYEQNPFEMNKSYVTIPWYSPKGFIEIINHGCYKKLSQIAKSLESDCQMYVKDIINTGEDYNEIYCQELLTMINYKMSNEEVRKLYPNVLFEVDLKLHILGRAATQFQKMHDDFGLNNDPKLLINRLKPQYFSIFQDKLRQKDESKVRARAFCQQCLKPSICGYVFNHLGKEIIDDVLNNSLNIRFNSQSHFHYSILKELLEINRFDHYAEYIAHYESYVKMWILKFIEQKYKNSKRFDQLVTQILLSVVNKIQTALGDKNVQRSQSITEFFEIFRGILSKHLVISKNAVKVIIFQNTADIRQFSHNIDVFLVETQEQIRAEIKSLSFEVLLSHLLMKPHIELFKRIIGCGKKCPFCNVPCEAGGDAHQEHFASAHWPKGLAEYTFSDKNVLSKTTCSTAIISNGSFRNPDTKGKWHPYRDYRTVYPQWIIHPERSTKSSLYWKFIFAQYNKDFAKLYQANPADIPEEWLTITGEQALSSLKEIYNIK